MPYSRNNLKKVREDFSKKRAEVLSEYELRKDKVSREIPEIIPVERELQMTGLKIMNAALSHELTEEKLSELKKENKELLRKKEALLTSHGYLKDCLDIKYNCEMCHDTGYVGIDMCSCMKKALVKAGFESSGLSALIERQSFESFDLGYYENGDKDKMERNLSVLKSFSENFDNKTNDSFLLLGATGLGKTHLSTSVAKVVIERGYDVVYESAQGIISSFETRRFGGDYSSDRESRFFECDLLIVDDLGVEVSNQFTISCIYNIINTRTNSRKSTIINTNLTQSELRQRYADRITSRLFGEFRPLLFTGKDIRSQKIKKG